MHPPWIADGWSAIVVIDRGLAFDFLAWYRALVMTSAAPTRPALDDLRGGMVWRLGRPGTCSSTHFKRMRLEKIGMLPIDLDRLHQALPVMQPGVRAAIADISIANSLTVTRPGKPLSTIDGLAHLLIANHNH
jgi:hypothetical protein